MMKINTLYPLTACGRCMHLVRFRTAAAVALAAALVATLGIAIVYIPSFVSTVLKFRSGYYASLRGGEPFQQLRSNSNQVTTLLGNAFWGAVYSGFLAALFAGGVAFFAVWSVSQASSNQSGSQLPLLVAPCATQLICVLPIQETSTEVMALFAIFVGFHGALFVYFVAIRLFRGLYIPSFYRHHPAAVNFFNAMLESWNLVVAVGMAFYRTMKLLVVIVYYIGRIDVPVFSPGVGYVRAFALDSEHFDFKRDLLIHEAVSFFFV
jgi:hypothetical protein